MLLVHFMPQLRQLLSRLLRSGPITIGVWAQSTFARKLRMKKKKLPQFYVIFARKLSKCQSFYDICPINQHNSRILHDNCPKNIVSGFFFFFGGGGHVRPCTPVSYAYANSYQLAGSLVWLVDDSDRNMIKALRERNPSPGRHLELCLVVFYTKITFGMAMSARWQIWWRYISNRARFITIWNFSVRGYDVELRLKS